MTGARVGSVHIDLGLNSAAFESGLKKANSDVGGFAKAMVAGFAAVTTAVVGAMAALRNTARQADQMWKSSQSLGVRIDELGRLRHAAEMSGASFSTLETGIRRASQAVSQSLAGMNTEATRALKGMGIAVKDADGQARSMSDILGDVAEQFSQMPDGVEKTSMAMALFGRSGTDLIPMLNAGRAGLKEMGDEAERLGLVFDEDTGRMAERFNDNMERMGKAAVGLSNAFGSMLLPVAVAVTDAIIAIQAPVGDTIAGLVELGKYAGVAAAGLAGFFAPAMLAGLASVSVAIGTTMVAAVRALTAAMMANPLGLLIGGIAAAITAAFLFRDQIKQVIGFDVVEVFKDAANTIIGAFHGAFKGIQAVWSSLPAVLGDVTITTANAVIDGIERMVNGAIDLLNGLFNGVRDMLSAIGVEVERIKEVDLGDIPNPYRGATEAMVDELKASFRDALDTDYIGEWTAALYEAWQGVDEGTEKVNALADALAGEGESGSGGGGGGGSLKNSLAQALEAMREALATEEELERLSHDKRIAQIQEFYNQGLILKDEYDQMMERAHQEHSDRMSEITRKQVEEEARIRSALVGHASSIFGSLSTIMENFGEDNLAASKAFAVAAAIINTAEGITKALAQGGILGFAGAASVAAAGMAQISTIMSASKGGGSRPSVGAAAPAPVQGSQRPDAEPQPDRMDVHLHGLDRSALYTGETVERLIELIEERSGDGRLLNFKVA